MSEAGLRTHDTGPIALLPCLTLVLAFLIDLAPLPSPAPDAPAPAFALPVLFYWTVHRPALLPPAAVFVIALTFDLASGGPLGLTAIVMLGLQGIALLRDRPVLGMSAGLMWLGFALSAMAVAAARWILGSIFYARLLDPAGMIMELVFSVAAFPLLVLLLDRIDRMLRGAGHASGS